MAGPCPLFCRELGSVRRGAARRDQLGTARLHVLTKASLTYAPTARHSATRGCLHCAPRLTGFVTSSVRKVTRTVEIQATSLEPGQIQSSLIFKSKVP